MSIFFPSPLDAFSVLAGDAVTTTGNFFLRAGLIGAGNSVTGFPRGPQIIVGGEVVLEALTQLSRAINALRRQLVTRTLPANLNSPQILPGVYTFTSNTVTISGDDGRLLGDQNSFFIFLIDRDLVINGNIFSSSNACNVYWVVKNNIDIQNSRRSITFAGNLLAGTNISNSLAENFFEGDRLLALNGITLNRVILSGQCISNGTGGIGGDTGIRRLVCYPIDDCICQKRRTKKCTKCHRQHICKFCGSDPRDKYDGNNDCVNRNVVATVNTNNGSGNCRTCGQR